MSVNCSPDGSRFYFLCHLNELLLIGIILKGIQPKLPHAAQSPTFVPRKGVFAYHYILACVRDTVGLEMNLFTSSVRSIVCMMSKYHKSAVQPCLCTHIPDGLLITF